MTEKEANAERSLVEREISRMADFAQIAENPSESDRLIDEIKDSYNMLKIGGNIDVL